MRKLEGYLFNSPNIYLNPTYNGNWIDNHDNPRFLNKCNDKRLFRNIIIFNIFYEIYLCFIMDMNNILMEEMTQIIGRICLDIIILIQIFIKC